MMLSSQHDLVLTTSPSERQMMLSLMVNLVITTYFVVKTSCSHYQTASTHTSAGGDKYVMGTGSSAGHKKIIWRLLHCNHVVSMRK